MVPLLFVIALSLVGPCFCAPLKSKSPVFKLTNSDFDHFLKDKDVMLVDFYAPWWVNYLPCQLVPRVVHLIWQKNIKQNSRSQYRVVLL